MKTCSKHAEYVLACEDCRKRKIRIYLGWPSTGEREDVHLYLLRDLQDRYGDKVELVLPDVCCHRIFHDRARNDLVEEFLASDCDVLWQLDSDVVPPTHILELVTHHLDKWQAAGAPYPVYQMVPGSQDMSICFTVYNNSGKEGDQRGFYMSDVPHEGTAFVDALATGCLFLKRSVFDSLSRPYFEFKYEPGSRRIVEGEDLGFALKLSDLGIKYFVDHSMICKHLKRVCLLEMSNYATRMRNAAVLEYDAMVKSTIVEAMKQAFEKGVEQGKAAAEKYSGPLYPGPKLGAVDVLQKAGFLLPESCK